MIELESLFKSKTFQKHCQNILERSDSEILIHGPMLINNTYTVKIKQKFDKRRVTTILHSITQKHILRGAFSLFAFPLAGRKQDPDVSEKNKMKDPELMQAIIVEH